MKNKKSELTLKDAKRILKELKESDGVLTESGKKKIEQIEKILAKSSVNN
jgi:hypothetical protein